MKIRLFLIVLSVTAGLLTSCSLANSETPEQSIIQGQKSDSPDYGDMFAAVDSVNSDGTTVYDIDSFTFDYTEVSEGSLLLVNKWNPIPDDYSAELMDLRSGHAIDKRAYPYLVAMLDAARAEGLSPIICSSYRTEEKQQTLYRNKVNSYIAQGYARDKAENEAGMWVAIPGTSEHQVGLAVDIVAQNYTTLDEKQEQTAEQQWLMQNSYKYGFILRYPENKSDITGIAYEPWHYRYVGVDIATEIFERGICLEEYIEDP